jgi:hypothetical protein
VEGKGHAISAAVDSEKSVVDAEPNHLLEHRLEGDPAWTISDIGVAVVFAGIVLQLVAVWWGISDMDNAPRLLLPRRVERLSKPA